MTRHAKNCTAGAVYTYHEKKKDAKTGRYGTLQQRIGKDSYREFDCCCLTLQPCRNPVVTPDGYLYDKEAVLEYIIHQKAEIARKMKAYEKQKKKEDNELQELAAEEQRSKKESFVSTEKSIVGKRINPFQGAGPSTSKGETISNVSNLHNNKLPSFWIPSLTPAAKASTVQKPNSNVLCPMSGRTLKVKDLIPIKFTLINDPDEKKSLVARKERYKCAVTHDVLNNSIPCAVLKPTGNVVTLECVEKLIKVDMIEPTTGQKLKDSDIIVLQRGGTGYASTNDNIDAKVKNPVIQA